MKRFLAISLALCLLFLPACNITESADGSESVSERQAVVSDSESQAVVSDNGSGGEEVIPEGGYEKAVYFIEKGDYKSAYFELCEIKDDPKAGEMLKNFKILPSVITTTRYNDEQEQTQNYAYTYDENGNIIKFTNENGTYELSYNERRNLTEIIRENETTEKYTYKYDSDGRTIEASEDDYVYKYEYDENGNVTKVTGAPIDETSIWHIRYAEEYFYDEEGYLIKGIPIAEANDEGAGYYFELELDDNKNIIKYKDEYSTAEFTYDNGLLTIELIQRTDTNVIIEYEYDENGNLLTRNVTQDDERLNSSLSFTYDENGLRVKAEGDDYHTEEYTYDEDGNIIKIRIDDSFSVTETTFANYQYFYSAEKPCSPFESKYQFFISPFTSNLGWYDYTPKVEIEKTFT